MIAILDKKRKLVDFYGEGCWVESMDFDEAIDFLEDVKKKIEEERGLTNETTKPNI